MKCPKCYEEISISELLWENSSIYRWLCDRLWTLEDEISFWRREFGTMPKWEKPLFVISTPLLPVLYLHLLVDELRRRNKDVH
jgi:hypothetical protein